MALGAIYFIIVLAGGAFAQQDGTCLLQASVESFGEEAYNNDFLYVTFVEGAFGLVPADAPAWCKNETQLTWKQRKDRMLQHATLQWCKEQVKKLNEENSTIPDWMDKIVSDDEKRGLAKWAVHESRARQKEGTEIPQWMADLVEEDAKWANRWAACRCAEMKFAGEDVPSWMSVNGRNGILEAAREKEEELEEQMRELEEQQHQEDALVDARGNVSLANERMMLKLARTKAFDTNDLNQSFKVLEQAVLELEAAETEMMRARPVIPTPRMRRAVELTRALSQQFKKVLEKESQSLLEQLEKGH